MLVYSKRSSKEGSTAGGRGQKERIWMGLTPPNSDAPNTRLLANAAPAVANAIEDYGGGLNPLLLISCQPSRQAACSYLLPSAICLFS
jgi:hypothetical protein